MDSLETAERLAPSSASVHLNLGVAYAQSGRLADARREAQEALRLAPDYEKAHALLAALDRR